MAAKLRLWRVPDFEKCKKVRNLLQKSENSEHFGKQHPFRSPGLKSLEISRVFDLHVSYSLIGLNGLN